MTPSVTIELSEDTSMPDDFTDADLSCMQELRALGAVKYPEKHSGYISIIHEDNIEDWEPSFEVQITPRIMTLFLRCLTILGHMPCKDFNPIEKKVK